ncbi:MAG: hypothetical protein A4E53_01491 [Pelotomaculum sp. PtaB.Bin104]|nr:MAG: hypothetical protein A4E53_01491 [Pelotomaculum sp. PtaB.Bin104]
MVCREALLLISPHLDGVISKNEEIAFAEHLAVCESCARELALQKRLSEALRNLGKVEIQAPQELCAQVMTRIRSQRHGNITWLPLAWRKAAATAAALLIIAGGYTGVSTWLKNAGSGKIVGLESTSPKINIDTSSDISTSEGPAQGSYIQPGESNRYPGITSNTGDSPGDIANNNTQENENKTYNDHGLASLKSSSTAEDNTAAAAAPAESEARALLKLSMKITSTLLKITVDDLNEARIKAVSLAAGAGAATQIFQEQDGNKKIIVLRLTVASNHATELIAGLNKLGAVIDRQDESRDINSLYKETLVQYRDLLSRKNLAKDTVEQQQLETQAASYQQQLETWDAEIDKWVITLWLESR